jgi:hypothetical protein
MRDTNEGDEPIHELWLIYCLLKDAEVDPIGCKQHISSARLKLGRVVNSMNRYQRQPKTACSQAAISSVAASEAD